MIIPVAVSGVRGRMAGIIADACRSSDELKLIGCLAYGKAREQTDSEADSNQKEIFSSLSEVADKNPVVIDFTHISQTRKLLRQVNEACSGLVIGTSGLMATLTGVLSRMLPDYWDAQILDLHYKTKVDTPSAAAKQLAQRWSEGKMAMVMPEIAALRVGDGISEHTLYMAGRGERLELAHRVLNRKAFLPAILDAGRFIYRQKAGFYSLDDVYPEIKCLHGFIGEGGF